jgi:hypothetical protein
MRAKWLLAHNGELGISAGSFYFISAELLPNLCARGFKASVWLSAKKQVGKEGECMRLSDSFL